MVVLALELVQLELHRIQLLRGVPEAFKVRPLGVKTILAIGVDLRVCLSCRFLGRNLGVDVVCFLEDRVVQDGTHRRHD